MACVLFLKRYWDNLGFEELALSPHERRVLSKDGRKLPPASAGFLVWRRAWLYLIAPCFIISTGLQIFDLYLDYNSRDEFFVAFFGSAWRLLEAAKEHFAPVYICSFLSAATLALVSVIACGQVLTALWRWPDYRRSGRLLRGAYLMCFATPFFFQLIFPIVQFINM